MAPGAHPHTNVAVGSDLAPVAETRFRIELPSLSAVDRLSISSGNRTGWAAVRAFFAKAAKILDTDIHRMIDNQGQIGRDSKKSDPRTQFFGNQISKTAQFTQTGVYGGGHQQKVIVAAVTSRGRIPKIRNICGQLGRNPGPF